MKILWLAHRDLLNPKAGGAEKTIYEVCARLEKNGHEITLLTGGWKGCKKSEYLNGVKICRYGGSIAPHFALIAYLIKGKYDVVINDLGHAIPWIFSTILGKGNIVFFRHLHSRSLPGQINPIIAKIITAVEKCYFIIYSNVPFVTESSTSHKDLLNLGIKENKINIIPPGVDTKLFHPESKTKETTIVNFGRLLKYKRPAESIYLVQNLIKSIPDIKLTIIGTGPEKQNVEKLAEELNLKKHISFTGWVTSEQLSKIVGSAWVNIHTSTTEGWGYSVMEASASGTPTVAYEVPGIIDAIQNEKNGIKVINGDRNALADAVFTILKDPEKWWSSSVEVAKKFSWDRTAEMWEELIQKIAGK